MKVRAFLIQISNSHEGARPHSRGAFRPSDCVVRPEKKRAQGMPGVWLHPQPCVRW
jgi:hypothetical protein